MLRPLSSSAGDDIDDGLEVQQENRPPSCRPTVFSVMFDMRRCLLVVFMFSCCQWMEMGLTEAFLRTTVTCEPGIPSPNNECPVGSFYQDAKCEAVPHGETDWSGSAHCSDKAYVVGVGNRFAGRLACLIIFVKLLSNIFIGAMLVDSLGRKPVMVMAFVGTFLLCIMLCVGTKLGSHNELIIVLYSTSLLVFVTNGFNAAASAMTADLTRSDDVQRSLGMTVLDVFANLGTMSSFVAGFFILQWELEDYSNLWTLCCFLTLLLLVVVMMTLQETFPEGRFTVIHRCFSSRLRCHAFRDVGRAFGIVWNDQYLRNGVLAAGLARLGCGVTMSIGNAWGISVCGYSQAEASIMGIVQPVFIILGSMASSLVVPSQGPHRAALAGMLMTTLGLCVTGTGAFYRERAPQLWWFGSAVMVGFGGGLSTPCFQGIWSTRVAHADQGKLFAVVSVVGGIAGAISVYLFTNVLFTTSPEDSDLQLASSWFVAAAVNFVGLGVMAYVTAFIAPGQQPLKVVDPMRAQK